MIEKPEKLKIALIGGTVIGVVSGIPGLSLVNCCCCAGIWLGGMLTMYLYVQQYTDEMQPLESSDALLLGLMSGLIGAVIATGIGVMIQVLFGPLQEQIVKPFMENIINRMSESGGMPSEALDQMRDEFDRSFRDSQTISGVIGGLFIALIVYPIFSIIGALIGYGLFRPKQKPQEPLPQV
ncbi:MAG: hypothetical protein V1799_06105 [bacterium]